MKKQATVQALTDDQLKAISGGTSLSYTIKLLNMTTEKSDQK